MHTLLDFSSACKTVLPILSCSFPFPKIYLPAFCGGWWWWYGVVMRKVVHAIISSQSPTNRKTRNAQIFHSVRIFKWCHLRHSFWTDTLFKTKWKWLAGWGGDTMLTSQQVGCCCIPGWVRWWEGRNGANALAGLIWCSCQCVCTVPTSLPFRPPFWQAARSLPTYPVSRWEGRENLPPMKTKWMALCVFCQRIWTIEKWHEWLFNENLNECKIK